MKFRTEWAPGRTSGGKVIVAVYADQGYMGAVAATEQEASEFTRRLRVADRIQEMHAPCHAPGDPVELCRMAHGDEDPVVVRCRECYRTFPCGSVCVAREVATPPWAPTPRDGMEVQR